MARMNKQPVIKINVYRAGDVWFGARWINGEYDGCDELGIPDESRDVQAIERAHSMPLAVEGARFVSRVDDV